VATTLSGISTLRQFGDKSSEPIRAAVINEAPVVLYPFLLFFQAVRIAGVGQESRKGALELIHVFHVYDAVGTKVIAVAVAIAVVIDDWDATGDCPPDGG
jgi:hypothetical protein